MMSSNIELCRVAAILLVILYHSASWTQGNLSSIDTCYVPALFIRGFSVIGVNVFIFISGWFGILPKRSSLINLLFIVLFWGFARVVALWGVGGIEWRALFVISSTNWFVISYLGLVLFSPLLNSFMDNSNKQSIKFFLACFFAYQAWFGWFPALPHFDVFQGGYSFVSFIFIYMLARYLRRYGIPSFLFKYSAPIYVVLSIISGIAAYYSIALNIHIVDYIFKYNNPIVVLSSLAFFLTFCKLRVPNLYWVNYMATSTLSVLLIHEPSPAHGIIKNHFEWLRDNMAVGRLLILWVLSIVVIYIGCVCLDQVRIFAYKPVKRYLKTVK